MFSKEEAATLRKEFWISFGKSFPRKWLLYHTKIKGVAFKFVADRKRAMVCFDMEHPDEVTNALIYEQLLSLKSILENDFLPEVIFDPNYQLENGKSIRRIYVLSNEKFSIYNKNTWQAAFYFFVEKMSLFEQFYDAYEVHIKQAV